MARPRKDSGIEPAEERLDAAFWQLIAEYPIDKISIAMITEQAECNRGTFYYYYHDIYHMLDMMIEKNLPLSLPQYLLPRFAEGIDAAELARVIADEQESFDRLCILLNADTSLRASKKLKAAILEIWSSILEIDSTEMPEDLRIVFEFGVNGLLGVLAYRAASGMQISISDIGQAIIPEIPEALITRIRGIVAQAPNNAVGIT